MKRCSNAKTIAHAADDPQEGAPQYDHGSQLDGVCVLIMASGHAATDPRICKQVRSLQGLGAQVTVVAALERGTPQKVRVLVVEKPSSRLRRFLWQPWRCLWKAWWQRPDIVHLHDVEMLIILPLAKLRWPRCRFVYDVREDFANLMLIRDWIPEWIKPTVRIAMDAIEKALTWFADGLVSVTPALAEKFNHRNKIVAYNFISREFFAQADKARRAPQQREFDVVHLGTLNLRRAIFLAETLQAFRRLCPRGRALVVGLSPEIEATISPLVPDGCVLLGRTPYEEIPALLGNSKVGLDVHPWLGPHLAVALAVKVCEYMAASCAVVASGMPVLNHLLADAQADERSITIIHGGTPADYAQAVARMIEIIEGGGDPGSALRTIAYQHMVWEEEAFKIVGLYRKLIGRSCAA
jgi:glycosyltransferase involved in cell wall biosynthesis